MYRMNNANNEEDADFLDDLSPLSEALISYPIQPPIAYMDLPPGSFITISSELCFKKFDIRFLNVVGDANISRTLGQIRENSVFRDLCTIVWDNSDTSTLDARKKNFFFGKRTNQQLALEYCILSFYETEESRSELDESDIMMMDEFKRILDFYKAEKTMLVKDDSLYMDIFNFFASRDMDLEATILAEKELEVPYNVMVEHNLVEEKAPELVDADEVMEDINPLSEYTLSRAEKFYMDCDVKNPKDVWNEFTVIDTDNFDFSKTNILLNQKCKNFFILEGKKGHTMKCFGLQYTDDVSFKNWLNRTPEQLKLWYPSDFQELLDFTDSSNLECFKNLDKEAINYETSVLHISAHMFFENTEVKQRWQSVLNDFAFKSGANKRTFKTATTLNKKREVEVFSSDANISMFR